MLPLEGEQLGEVEHGVDLLEVLHAVLHVLCVGRQVRVHEHEGGAEQQEPNRHGALDKRKQWFLFSFLCFIDFFLSCVRTFVLN